MASLLPAGLPPSPYEGRKLSQTLPTRGSALYFGAGPDIFIIAQSAITISRAQSDEKLKVVQKYDKITWVTEWKGLGSQSCKAIIVKCWKSVSMYQNICQFIFCQLINQLMASTILKKAQVPQMCT